jgi:hypothetical protein
MARRVILSMVMIISDGDDEDCVQEALDRLDGFSDNTSFARDGERFIGTSSVAGGTDWQATVENTGD